MPHSPPPASANTRDAIRAGRVLAANPARLRPGLLWLLIGDAITATSFGVAGILGLNDRIEPGAEPRVLCGILAASGVATTIGRVRLARAMTPRPLDPPGPGAWPRPAASVAKLSGLNVALLAALWAWLAAPLPRDQILDMGVIWLAGSMASISAWGRTDGAMDVLATIARGSADAELREFAPGMYWICHIAFCAMAVWGAFIFMCPTLSPHDPGFAVLFILIALGRLPSFVLALSVHRDAHRRADP